MLNDVWDYITDKKLQFNVRISSFYGFSIMTAVNGIIQLKSGFNNKIAAGLFAVAVILFGCGFICSYKKKYYKVCVGRNGFYIQTTRKNGRYFEYKNVKTCYRDYKFYISTIEKAFFSYFHFTTFDNQEYKFNFHYNLHYKAMDELENRIKHQRKHRKSKNDNMNYSVDNEIWDYTIDGKKGSAARLIFMAIAAALFSAMAIIQYIKAEKISIPVIMFSSVAFITIVLLLTLVKRCLFFRVKIGRGGFHLKTGILKGQYYEYRYLEKAEIVSEASPNNPTSSFWFFKFTDNNGLTQKFQIDPAQFKEELAELKKRIEE